MSSRKAVVYVSRNVLCILLIVSLAFSGLLMTGCKKAEVPAADPIPAKPPADPPQPAETAPSGTATAVSPVVSEPSGQVEAPGASSETPGTDAGSAPGDVGQPSEGSLPPSAESDDSPAEESPPPPSGVKVVPGSPTAPIVTPTPTQPPALFPVSPKLSIAVQPKLLITESSLRLVQLELRSPATLFASSGPGKPAALPGKTLSIPIIGSGLVDTDAVFVDTKPYYTAGHRAAFVQRGGDERLWFATSIEGSGVSKILWQVSDMPFDAASADWRSPPGLIQSGEIISATREFVLDFAAIHTKRKNPYALVINQNLLSQLSQIKVGGKYLNPHQTSYFVRAVALDSSGKKVGAAGRGLEIIYGDRLTYQAQQSLPFTLLFDLLPAKNQGDLVYSGEFLNDFHAADEKLFRSDKSYPWYFRPEGFPKTVDTILLQVSRSKLPTSTDNWRDPADLVYELELKKGTPLFDDLAYSRKGIPVDFNAFARSMLGTKLVMFTKNIEFHIRVVALYPGQNSGTVRAAYSKSVKVVYGKSDSQITYYPPPETINPLLPSVRIKEYQPIKWEEPDWMYYYEVVRQPTYGDYFPGNFTGGFTPTDPVPGMTVGTVIKLQAPGEKDKSWLAEAWEAVTSYFSDLISFLAQVTNWVSETYAKLKADLVKFVAQNIPLLPQSLKNKLQEKLAMYLDYGLMYMGIPPSLPNFDKLSSMGVDYLAATALDYAGVPVTDYNMDALKDLSGGLYTTMSENASSGSAPNPLDWDFVRQWPEALYRPAYMLFEVHNPHKVVTPPAVLEGRVFRNITQAELGNGNIMSLVSAFGNSKYFELYLPVRDVRVPRLLPGQTLSIPIYFTEYTGSAYPFHPAKVTQNQFLSMYNLNYFEFSFRLRFDLPTAQEYSKQLNLPQDRGYEYSATGLSIYYKGAPTMAYKK